MQPQSPPPPEAMGITARLAGLTSDVDGQLADPAEQARRLVEALTQQLAAGQVETLYGLHSAAAAVGRRVTDLERAAEALPEGLSRLLTAVTTDVASAALQDMSESLAASQEAFATRLARLRAEFAESAASVQAELVSARAASAAATTLSAESLAVGERSLIGALGELRTQLEDAKGTVRDTGASLRAEATAMTAALTERFAQVEADLRTVASEVLVDVEQAADRFVREASEVTRGMTSFGEAFIARLITTLDERDKRDQLLEERLTARVDRLTKKTADSVARLSDSLAEQLRSLEERDLSQQRTAVQDLQALLETVLAEPRGKLKAMRAATREGQIQQEDRT